MRDVRIDITSRIFNRLTVLGFAEKRGRKLYWNCRCSCGTVKAVHGDHLKSGAIKSCGCLGIEAVVASLTTHGGCSSTDGRHPLYGTWCNMKQRCYNPANPAYKYYGGRGISICAEWVNDFAKFRDDIGTKPSPIHSIDRIDPDGNYEPANCRWATPKQQAENRIWGRFKTAVAA